MADAKKGFQGDDLIKSLEDVFKNAPSLPTNIKEVLVKIAPWLALVAGLLGLLFGLMGLGLSPLGLLGGLRNGVFLLLASVLVIVAAVVDLMAFPKLNKREYAGWKLIFWSEIAWILWSLFAGNIIGAILGAVIGLYILFQVKSYYK